MTEDKQSVEEAAPVETVEGAAVNEGVEEELVFDEGENENDGKEPVPEGSVPIDELTVPQLAQAMQSALSNVISTMDGQLQTIKADISEIKRFEGKQEGYIKGKLEEYEKSLNGRIGNVKTRLLKIEKAFKGHSHKSK